MLWHSLIIWVNNNIYYISNDAKYSINNSNECILINYGNNINKVLKKTSFHRFMNDIFNNNND